MINIIDFINKKENETIDEGISINDFKKLMYKTKKAGVNLNYVSATELMFYFYRCMGKEEFKALSDKVESIDSEEIKKIEDKNLDQD